MSAIRQTRIFAPSVEPQDDWAETLIGRVIRPLTQEFADRLDWFWFSRYGSSTDETADCDIERIPAEYKQFRNSDGRLIHRSLRFRYAIADDERSAFEQRALDLFVPHGYRISDFRSYDFVGDAGNNRFLGTGNRLPGRDRQRAQLVTQFYMSASKLVIDALVGPDENARYHAETNDDTEQNPAGSTFQSLLHLFCNITKVPTEVYVFRKEGLNVLGFGTFVYPPPPPPGAVGWDDSTAHPIWF